MSKEDQPLTQETDVSVQHPKTQHSGVWFFAEHKGGTPEEGSLRLAGEAKNLANKLGQEACALILGHQVEGLPHGLGLYGTDRVFLVDDPHLDIYSSETYVDALAQLAESHPPSIILFSSTPLGNDLAPRLAAKIKASFAARYTEIDTDGEGRLTVRRAVHGGNADATATSLRQPLVATIDPQSLGLQKAKQETNPVVTEPKVWVSPRTGKTTTVDYLRADPCAVCVSEAEIVIGIGKGLGSAHNLDAIEDLARILGASIGGSRRATDEHWVADERRIGLTGKTITPRLYLICGISGAFHHTLSIKGAQFKVVVNTDEKAPIAKMADLMVVGDMQEILPELARQLRETVGPPA
ncbi:MAG: electron transfer flavoprotein subunit alpha/FixB family protein [Dehalococcoidia bacterium]